MTVNAIAPRARTRMTTSSLGYPGVEEGTFDNRAPENISPVVAWLASPAAGHISAKVFACYGGEVDLQTPIECRDKSVERRAGLDGRGIDQAIAGVLRQRPHAGCRPAAGRNRR